MLARAHIAGSYRVARGILRLTAREVGGTQEIRDTKKRPGKPGRSI